MLTCTRNADNTFILVSLCYEVVCTSKLLWMHLEALQSSQIKDTVVMSLLQIFCNLQYSYIPLCKLLTVGSTYMLRFTVTIHRQSIASLIQRRTVKHWIIGSLASSELMLSQSC